MGRYGPMRSRWPVLPWDRQRPAGIIHLDWFCGQEAYQKPYRWLISSQDSALRQLFVDKGGVQEKQPH